MAFDEVRFPTLIDYGYGGGPEYSTDVVVLAGGAEKRNSNWQAARSRYEVAHRIKDQDQLDELITFFRARQGKARGFRFRDWFDYKLQDELIGAGDGSETEFQIIKTYTNSVSEVRNITKIVTQSDANAIAAAHGSTALTFVVKVNTVAQTEGGGNDYTIDRNTGIITFNSPVTNTHPITVTCEFDIPVRFDTDRMFATIESFENHMWDGVPLIEVRV